MQLKVTVDGTDYEVSTKPVDSIAFERQYGLPWAEAEGNPKLEHSYFIAWHACQRTGITQLEFDDWLALVDDVEGEEEPPLDPTKPKS